MKAVFYNCPQCFFLFTAFLFSINARAMSVLPAHDYHGLRHHLDLKMLEEELEIKEKYKIREVPDARLKEFLRANGQDPRWTYATIAGKQDGAYQVWVSDKTPADIYDTVLVHELIHVRQYIVGSGRYKAIPDDPRQEKIKIVLELDAWNMTSDLAETYNLNKIFINRQRNAYRYDVNINNLQAYRVDISSPNL